MFNIKSSRTCYILSDPVALRSIRVQSYMQINPGPSCSKHRKLNKLVCLFVIVEILRPSQPNGVMSSEVSLPNHTFTGQA